MTRFFARVWAKRAYIWRLEFKARTAELTAQLSLNNGNDKKALAQQLNTDADTIEQNIKTETAALQTGYWECENGHKFSATITGCPNCHQATKFVKLSEMTGQEKYELEKEQKEAEQIVTSKREQAKQEAVNAEECNQTAKHFLKEAANDRLLADKIRAI
jgi:hypothetical protein